MPNWCGNHLIITGAPAEVAHFRRHMASQRVKPMPWLSSLVDTPDQDEAEGPLSFAQVAPIPPSVRLRGEAGGGRGWSLEAWSAKWDLDADTEVILVSDHEVQYRFNTAWSPPAEWFLALARAYPALRLSLHFLESGNGLHGVLRAEGGRVEALGLEGPEDCGPHALLHFGFDPTAFDEEGTEIESPYEPRDPVSASYASPQGDLSPIIEAISSGPTLPDIRQAVTDGRAVLEAQGIPSGAAGQAAWNLALKHCPVLDDSLVTALEAAGASPRALAWRPDISPLARAWVVRALGAPPVRGGGADDTVDSLAATMRPRARDARAVLTQWADQGRLDDETQRVLEGALDRLPSRGPRGPLTEALLLHADLTPTRIADLAGTLTKKADSPLRAMVLQHPRSDLATRVLMAERGLPVRVEEALLRDAALEGEMERALTASLSRRLERAARTSATGHAPHSDLVETLRVAIPRLTPQQFRAAIRALSILRAGSVPAFVALGTETQQSALRPSDLVGALTSANAEARGAILPLLSVLEAGPVRRGTSRVGHG